MNQQMIIFTGILLLAIGTYLIRYSGFVFNQYFSISKQQEQLFNDAATTLLFSIAILSTFFEANGWADFARICGVLVALYLIWKNYSLITIILIATLITTLFRLIISCNFN
ncbi:AzlD domain-containing protein [Acinetobacter nematophilus]|uniref:AzlD domain-containing protein n=1 Tax=Acinetobacter nematophilus TaxID=2994642 RepID=A0A9X3DSA8_9GAMM|nr:AzlD domain-containing protein [Acinetobacter nematophilus]MCX5467071.1 AzlD domain-containing protein [Acinetobacter nematophilus]